MTARHVSIRLDLSLALVEVAALSDAVRNTSALLAETRTLVERLARARRDDRAWLASAASAAAVDSP